MSKQSAITRAKSTKETQEETVKQAQSQQYRHQSDILDINLLPPLSTPYLFYTSLQSPHFDSKQTNADIVGISQRLKSNKIYASQQSSEYPTVKPNLHILYLKQSLCIVFAVKSIWFPFSNFVSKIFKVLQIFHFHCNHWPSL